MSDTDVPTLSPATQTPPLPYTLRQLECFLAVAESGSNRACSAHPQRFGLGRLRSRSPRSNGRLAQSCSGGVSVPWRDAHLGRNHDRADRASILTEGAELSASVGRELSAIVGPVRIGVLNTLASVILPASSLRCNASTPGSTSSTAPATWKVCWQLPIRGELDLVASFDMGMPPEYPRIAITVIQAMLVVAADHPLAERRFVSLTEVADEPMIMLDIVASRSHTLERMSSQGITPRIAHRTPDYELCRELVGRGLGYTLLMRRTSLPDTWDGTSSPTSSWIRRRVPPRSSWCGHRTRSHPAWPRCSPA